MKRLVKRLAIAGVVFCLLAGIVRAENAIVSELKTWQYNIGDCAYLIHAQEFYYGIGVEKDLADVFNVLVPGYLYGGAGYLHDKTVGGVTDQVGGKAYGYIGLSANVGRLAVEGISWVGEKLNANFKIPAILEEVLVRIGLNAAKKIDGDFWSLKGLDWGPKVSVITIKF